MDKKKKRLYQKPQLIRHGNLKNDTKGTGGEGPADDNYSQPWP